MTEPEVLSHNAVLSLAEGLKRVGEVKLPIKAAYAVAKTKSQIQGRLDAIEAGRVALVKEYAGEADRVPEDKFTEFSEDWAEFLKGEEQINLHKFGIKTLLDADLKIEADTLFLLDAVLTDDTMGAE